MCAPPLHTDSETLFPPLISSIWLNFKRELANINTKTVQMKIIIYLLNPTLKKHKKLKTKNRIK